jgi:hypothetical protein
VDLVKAQVAEVAFLAVLVIGGYAATFVLPRRNRDKSPLIRARSVVGVVLVIAVGVLSSAAWLFVIDS